MGCEGKILKGCALGLLAFFFMAVFGVFTKIAIHDSSVLWVSFISYLTGTLLFVPLIVVKGGQVLKQQRPPLHIARVVFGLSASLLYTISLNYIPIINATLLYNTTPLFIPMLSIFMLGQKVSKETWWSILIGFIGVIIIIKPTMNIFDQAGDLIALSSGISLAVAYVFIKMMTATETRESIVFYYFFLGTCLQLVFLPFLGHMPDMRNVGFAVAAGAALFLAQQSLVKAYRYATASDVGVFQYASVIFVGLIDWLVWGTTLPLSDMVGILFVIVAGIVIIRRVNNHSVT